MLEEAERRQILVVRAEGVAFRHELARQALLRSIPRTRQVALHQNVLADLLEQERPDLSRVVHHAVAAGDVDTVLGRGQEAARQAAGPARTGRRSRTTSRSSRTSPCCRPRTRRGCSSTTPGSCTSPSAGPTRCGPAPGVQALGIARRPGGRGRCPGRAVPLVVHGRRPNEAIREAERAVAVLRPTGDIEALAYAETYLGAVQALTDRQEEALTRLLEAQALAARAGRRDLVALCHNYIGCARVDLGDVDSGLEELRRSLWLSLDLPHHEYAARAYTNLAETAYQLHRYDELATWVDEGSRFTADHDLPGHLHNLEAHRALLLLSRGRWDEAADPAGAAGLGLGRAGPADPADPAAARTAAGAAR